MNLAVEAEEFHAKPSSITSPHHHRPCTINHTRENSMAAYLTSILLMILVASTSALDEGDLNKEITISMQEMQRASYFTFVTLLNMVKDNIPQNTTFLMPSDRALSKASIPENKTLEFLLRHSIPSTLLFDELSHLPTGTTVPTHQQDYALKIVNGGRRDFHLNNVQLVSADICAAGTYFRCHGIYGVLMEETNENTANCSQRSPPTEREVGPSSAPPQPSPPPPPLEVSPSLAPTISPPTIHSNDGFKKSSWLCQGSFTGLVLSVVLSVM
ncbi:uncharacterized protein A4U43_C08F1310 [Asparagus officinalis]|uniref:FAS1 domain-containing protein SELMODRAFT_448915-like n=1 Tax=Asparagus officinalis TaxID=4686 RepID=UPI00098E4E23|nr:FAS1 domain-containing protein SELMODRAFT_448915-like [Asparagus officinalis]ONK58941.1 uncharacterized protein A4U43_C08F1310 [Asparagus officinalis]